MPGESPGWPVTEGKRARSKRAEVTELA